MKSLIHILNGIHNCFMCYNNSFRFSSASRGIDYVCLIGRLVAHRKIPTVKHLYCITPIKIRRQRKFCLRIFLNILFSFLRICRIDWNIRCSCLEYSNYIDNTTYFSGNFYNHMVSTLNTSALQVCRHFI